MTSGSRKLPDEEGDRTRSRGGETMVLYIEKDSIWEQGDRRRIWQVVDLKVRLAWHGLTPRRTISLRSPKGNRPENARALDRG
jgi:hypothetical protein